MRPFLAVLGGTAFTTALGTLLGTGAVALGDRFPSGTGLLIFTSGYVCGLFGSGFGVIAAVYSEGRCPTWKSSALGMSIPALLFIFLAFSGAEFRSPWGALAVLAALLLPGAIAGTVAARIMTKGTHGTA